MTEHKPEHQPKHEEPATVAPIAEAVPTPETTPQPTDNKVSKVKLGFLYVLIGGVVISALISVVAILVGEFNSVIQKALLTTFSFVIHSLIVLSIVLSDKENLIGKSLIPTTILGAVIANMLTSVLGIWEILPDDGAMRAFFIYVLLIGSAFLITGAGKLRLAHKATSISTTVTVWLLITWTLSLIPWVAAPEAEWLNASDLYYRIIGALSILAATALSLSVIFNRIAVSQKPELAQQASEKSIEGPLLGVVISVGVIASLFWMFGLFAFIATATTYNSRQQYEQQQREFREEREQLREDRRVRLED